MNKVRFFLKFGKREHLESFVAGNLFCSNAITFWEIEKKLRMSNSGKHSRNKLSQLLYGYRPEDQSVPVRYTFQMRIASECLLLAEDPHF